MAPRGRRDPSRGAPDLALLARLVLASRRPSPQLLSALAEAAHAAGRSLERIARQAGASRQAAARWVAGGPVRTSRARRGLRRLAASLAASGGSIMEPRTKDVRGPGLSPAEVNAVALLCERCGWLPGQVEAWRAGRVRELPLPGGVQPAAPGDVVIAAAELFKVPVLGIAPGTGVLGRHTTDREAAVRRAVVIVLDALGHPPATIARTLGVHHATVAHHLGRAVGGAR